jgi:hypothetical protein
MMGLRLKLSACFGRGSQMCLRITMGITVDTTEGTMVDTMTDIMEGTMADTMEETMEETMGDRITTTNCAQEERVVRVTITSGHITMIPCPATIKRLEAIQDSGPHTYSLSIT